MARTTEENIVNNAVTALRNKRQKAITSVVDNGGNSYTLNTICTFDTTAGHLIDVGGNTVTVKSVVADTSITVESSVSLVGEVLWKALAPYFFFGNLLDVNNEIDKAANQKANYPAIILSEITGATVITDVMNSIDRISPLNLYFMDMTNYEDNTIQDMYDSAVDRMQELSIEFVKELRKQKGVCPLIDDYTEDKHSKWGLLVVRNGINGADTIFDNNLTGVEISGLNMPVQKNLNLQCNLC